MCGGRALVWKIRREKNKTNNNTNNDNNIDGDNKNRTAGNISLIVYYMMPIASTKILCLQCTGTRAPHAAYNHNT